tara:strand:- start:844 stop:2565 length:1722 start_codon:yes stop_codon:yes gene_type:complete
MKNYYQTLNKFFDIITPKQRREYWMYFFLFIVAAILETLGISLIFILLNLMVLEKSTITFSIIDINLVNINQNYKSIILLSVVFLYFIKSAFLSFFYWSQNKFVFDVEVDIAKRLFYGYLLSPLKFHLNTNTSELIRNITVETGQLSGGILTNSLLFFKNFFLLIFLIIFLLNINFKITLVVFALLLMLGFLYQQIMTNKNSKWGKDRQIQTGWRIRNLQEAFQGIKTIKVFKKENFFFNRILPILERINLIRLFQTFLKNLPRIWFEFLAVLGLVVLIIYYQKGNNEFINIIPTLGVLALVIVRLLPAITSMLNNFQHMDYSSASVTKINNDLKYFQENKIERNDINIKFQNKIEFKDVTFKYSESSNTILKKINLEIKKFQSIGIYGKSGAGKSTILNLILGLLNPTSGLIKIDGHTHKQDNGSLTSLFSYVPQDIFLIDESIKKNIILDDIKDDKFDEKLNSAIEKSELDHLIKSLKNKENTGTGELGKSLSGGEKQRIAIARALFKDSEILVFDEATKSLDQFNQDQINKLIKSFFKRKTIINVTHDLDTLKGYDVIYKIENGNLEKID